MEKLTISSVTAATEAFDRLRVAIEAVNAEIDKLAGKRHGGIKISAVGSVIQCVVKPAVENETTIRAVINEEIRAGLRSYAEQRE